ncbi:MAG: hypothetical protein IKO52_06340 [Clostridia bacterium]|nr:hypothetical protein [Clostridia bacterium]
MTIETHTNDRKALVKAIADELGTTSTYLRAPTYAYQVGDYTVDRDGNIIGEDFAALYDFLWRNGLLPEEIAANLEAPAVAQSDDEASDSEETEDAAEQETPADSEAEPVTSMEITIPAHDVTVGQLKNLTFMLYARQALINRMTRSDCLNIPDILIERLKEEPPETLEDFTSLLDDSKAIAGMTGFDFQDGKVSMAFPFDETEPTKWTAYANLLNRIYDAAVKATRVFPDKVEPDAQNEKYLAHTWLQRLGYSGADFKAERKILLRHLTGYCAFANDDKMQAHKEKYTAIRRERRTAEQEAAVMEVMTEEADGNE